ncbi:hypothetical protein ES707_01416 [subsurface metagenome]
MPPSLSIYLNICHLYLNTYLNKLSGQADILPLLDIAGGALHTKSMKAGTKAYIAEEGGKVLSSLVRMAMSRSKKVIIAAESGEEAPLEQNVMPTQELGAQVELPTAEETAQALKRRLGKELYRAELDLSAKLRINGKPCDCLESKHTLLLEAAAEELIAQEPDNPVYFEIIAWITQNQSKVTIEAISTGKYDEEYPRMAAEFKGFRKRIMGTTTLTAMVEPKQEASAGRCPNCGGPLDKDGCCPKCKICPLTQP